MTRADLLRRNGRDTEARQAYQRALELTQTEPERRFLQDRLAELSSASDGGRWGLTRDIAGGDGFFIPRGGDE